MSLYSLNNIYPSLPKGDFWISETAQVIGNVKIGKFTHLGSGTSVHPGIKVGDNVKTGVGSKIFKDILDDTVHNN